jgi:hypothetical protein
MVTSRRWSPASSRGLPSGSLDPFGAHGTGHTVAEIQDEKLRAVYGLMLSLAAMAEIPPAAANRGGYLWCYF